MTTSPESMRLTTAVTLTLAGTFLASFALVAVLFVNAAQREAHQEAVREARMIMAAGVAARTYTDQQISPLLLKLQEDDFHPQSVPSFGAQKVVGLFTDSFPEYTYREIAMDPTNLDDRPRSWEADVIAQFRESPTLGEIIGERQTDDRSVLFLAEPFRIANKSCLSCHSTAEAAPPGMVKRYGPLNGFGWKLGDTVGARFVTVPKTARLEQAMASVTWFLIALGSVLVMALVASLLVLRRTVTEPLQKLMRRAEALSIGQRDADELPETGPTEIRRLALALNRLPQPATSDGSGLTAVPLVRDLLGLAVLALVWSAYDLVLAAPGGPNSLPGHVLWLLAWALTDVAAVIVITALLLDVVGRRLLNLPANPLIHLIVRLAVMFAVVSLTLKYALGFNIAALLTTSAVLTLVLGLALQSSLTALFSGIALQFGREIRPGDGLRVEGRFAEVEHVGWRSVRARRQDGSLAVVPNAQLANGIVTLLRAGNAHRFDVPVPAPLSVPPGLIAEIIRPTVAAVSGVSPSRSVLVAATAMQPNAGLMDMRVSYWWDGPPDDGPVNATVLLRIWYAYQRNGIVLPGSVSIADVVNSSRAVVGAAGPVIGSPAAAQKALLRSTACANWRVEQLADVARTGRWLFYAPGETVALPADCASMQAVIIAGDALALGVDPPWITPPTAAQTPDLPPPWESEQLLEIEAQLGTAIGPYAQVAVAREAERHRDRHSLYHALAENILDGPSRTVFLQSAPAEASTAYGPGSAFTVGTARRGQCSPGGSLRAATHLEILVLPSEAAA